MPRRNKKKREADFVTIEKMYFSGSSQAEIGKALEITQQQVSKDLIELEHRWIAESLADLTIHKARELRRINQMEREAWAAWERSKKPEDYTRVSASGVIRRSIDDEGAFVQENPATTIKTQRSSVGDPRFLAIVKDCIKLRMDLLGLSSPEIMIAAMPLANYGENFINIPNN